MTMTASRAKALGAVVAAARARKGFSVRVLAAKLDRSTAWITRLEQGQFLDPSPDRLARIAELLDIEPSRIDRLTRGTVAEAMPGLQTYFRAKYDLTPEQIERIERYVQRLQREDGA